MSEHDDMRARFHELGVQREAILAEAGPIRAERDRLSQEHEALMASMFEQIKAAEAGLFEIDMARGQIAESLGGRTGPPPPLQ